MRKFASLTVDMQNGFTPNCPNELAVGNGLNIVSEIIYMEIMSSFRIGSKDWHSPKALWGATSAKPQFSPITHQPDMDKHWNMHCVGGTFGAELVKPLRHPRDYDYFVWKGMELDMHPYSAVYHNLKKTLSTGMIEKLAFEKVTDVIVGGLATDYCVKESALDLAASKLFTVYLYLPACAGIAPDTVKEAITEMMGAGVQILYSKTDLEELVAKN